MENHVHSTLAKRQKEHTYIKNTLKECTLTYMYTGYVQPQWLRKGLLMYTATMGLKNSLNNGLENFFRAPKAYKIFLNLKGLENQFSLMNMYKHT